MILVPGALGQIGAELVPALRQRNGAECVIAADIRAPALGATGGEGPFEQLDCTSTQQI